jgi:hypothetical protein
MPATSPSEILDQIQIDVQRRHPLALELVGNALKLADDLVDNLPGGPLPRVARVFRTALAQYVSTDIDRKLGDEPSLERHRVGDILLTASQALENVLRDHDRLGGHRIERGSAGGAAGRYRA